MWEERGVSRAKEMPQLCPLYPHHLVRMGRVSPPVMPGLGITGRDGWTRLPAAPRRKQSSTRAHSQALAATSLQQHPQVPEPRVSHAAAQRTLPAQQPVCKQTGRLRAPAGEAAQQDPVRVGVPGSPRSGCTGFGVSPDQRAEDDSKTWVPALVPVLHPGWDGLGRQGWSA